MKELLKWQKEKYAVNIPRKSIFEIDEIEVVGDDIIIYAGKETQSARNLNTVQEAYYLEGIKEQLKCVF